MAKLWKGLRGIVKKNNNSSDIDYSVFSKEMTLKMVFLGGHQSGKTSIVRILNKQKFSKEYDPTIGIDQHKIRLEHTERKESLWIWDISHAELGGVHEPLIFHQTHGIILVTDLTNFRNIQAIDQWLHSISVYLKRLLETNKENKNNKEVLLPRLYLLISKYDLSNETILTDTQLHKFCKSNSIRAFARISSKLDKRQEMLEIFSKFSQDIIKHLPKKYNILSTNNYDNEQRYNYDYAIKRLQRNKINDILYKNKNIKSIFDVKTHSIKTFKWMTNEDKNEQDIINNINNINNEEDKNESDYSDKRLIAQNKLKQTEQNAKRVLVSMKESINLQKNKTMRDAREYQKTLLRLKAMNQLRQEKEYKYKNDKQNYLKNQSKIIDDGIYNKNKNKENNSLLNHDVITTLKLDMITSLNLQIDNLTKIWEDELNTIAELIRFQIPLIRTNANLHRLSQQIIAREMLFKRRIRLVSELRTQNKLVTQQMDMMKQQELEEIDNAEIDIIKQHINHNNNYNTNKKSFFSSLVGGGKNGNLDVLP